MYVWAVTISTAYQVLPSAFVATNKDASAGSDRPPETRVKQRFQKMPCFPPSEPVVGLTPPHSTVSGYLALIAASAPAFCCCAVKCGFSAPLAKETKPRPFGSDSVIDSLSLADTAHPGGTETVTTGLVAVGPVSATGEATGLGDPAGLGLGTSDEIPSVRVALPPSRAIAVPQPAMTTISATTAPMIRTHGVRWTGACGIAAVGA